MRGQFIVSFIPRHVSNGVLLKVYRMLSLFDVPRFVRKKHYRENGMRLEQSSWDEGFVWRSAESVHGRADPHVYDKNDITRQIHTVCITKKHDGNYVLHNAYCRDQTGRNN